MPVGLTYGDGPPLAAPRGISKLCQRYYTRTRKIEVLLLLSSDFIGAWIGSCLEKGSG